MNQITPFDPTRIIDTKMTIDEQGNIRLPATLREQMGIYAGDQFEAIIHEGRITLARHVPTCLACGDDCDVQKLHKTFLCGECRDVILASLRLSRLPDNVAKNGGSEAPVLEVVLERGGLRLVK